MLGLLSTIWFGRIVKMPPEDYLYYLQQLETVGTLSTELYLMRLDPSLTKTQLEELNDKIILAKIEYESLISYLK